MNQALRVGIQVGALIVASAVFAGVTIAEDEDLTASVYLVFDAETGEFVEVNDPSKAQQTHGATDSATASSTSSDGSQESSPAVPIAVIAALLAIIGIYKVAAKRR